jgi:protein phosphatase
MIISVGAKTDIGRRRIDNEDNFCVDVEIGLLAVADGVGGAAYGELASKMGVEIIRSYIRSPKTQNAPIIDNLQKEFSKATMRLNAAIMFANQVIYEASRSNPLWQGMSATLAAVLLENNRLSLIHAGDSRIYLIRAGMIERLTDDHTFVYEQVSKGLSPGENEQTSLNVITRALGVSPEIETSVDEMTIFDGDILLLCTDGLNTLLSDDEMAETIKTSRSPKDACNRLVDMANARGGLDNITVITAFISDKRRFSFLYDIFKKAKSQIMFKLWE